MGSYDGAEVCELVGIFLLSELSNVMNKRILDSIETMALLFYVRPVNLTLNV